MKSLTLTQSVNSLVNYLPQPAGDLDLRHARLHPPRAGDSADAGLPALPRQASRGRGGPAFNSTAMPPLGKGHTPARTRQTENRDSQSDQRLKAESLPIGLHATADADAPGDKAGADAAAPNPFLPAAREKRKAKKLRFMNPEQQRRLESKPAFIKTSGNPLNPLKWASYVRSLVRGSPELTVGTEPLFKKDKHFGQPVVIDGFDDLGYVIQSTGVSKQLAAALQAFVFYPPVLALVNMGATESRHDGRQSRKAYREAQAALDKAREALIAKAREIDPALAEKLKQTRTHAELGAQLLATLEHTIAHAPPAARRAIGGYLQLIASYKDAADKLPMVRLQARSSYALTLAAHGMLAGTLLYQCAAAAQLGTSAGALAASGALGIAGFVVMLVAQVAMGGYGGLQVAKGIKTHRWLGAVKQCIAESDSLSDEARRDLLSVKSRQILVNKIGQIGSSAGLIAGQAMMALGSTLAGAPALAVGVLLILGSIAVKVGAQRYYDKHFSFDPYAIDLSRLANAASLEEAVQILESGRKPAMASVAWLHILREIDKLNDKARKEGTGKDMRALEAACSRLLTADHERSQRQVMDSILNEESYRTLLQERLDSSGDGVNSVAALILAEAPQPVDIQAVQAEIRDYTQASRSQKLANLFQRAKSAGLENQVMQGIVDQLVFRENSRANRKGSAYRRFLDTESVVQRRKILWNKTKTVYSFKPDALLAELVKSDDDPLVNHVEAAAYRAIEKAVAGAYLYKKRSQLLATDDMIGQYAVLERTSQLTPDTTGQHLPPRSLATAA